MTLDELCAQLEKIRDSGSEAGGLEVLVRRGEWRDDNDLPILEAFLYENRSGRYRDLVILGVSE